MLGITNPGMTYYERYQAVKSYWGEQKKFKKKRVHQPPAPMKMGGCNCDGAGWFNLVMPSGHTTLTKCSCGAAGSSSFERMVNKELDILQFKTFDNFTVDRPYTEMKNASTVYQRSMVDIAVSKAKSFSASPNGWLYIHGAPGTGKSHLAAAIANENKARMRIIYRSMPAMLDMIRENQQQLDTMLGKIADAELVIIDDIGADGRPTEWAEGRIFRLINDRVDKATVFTSNYDVGELQYQERIIDRLNASRRSWLHTTSMRGKV
jgi:DNA replication protein DnaC